IIGYGAVKEFEGPPKAHFVDRNVQDGMGTCPVSRRAATGKMNFGYTGTGNYFFRFKKFNGQKRDFLYTVNVEIGFSQKIAELLIYRVVLILKPEGLQDHRIKIHIGFYIKNSVG